MDSNQHDRRDDATGRFRERTLAEAHGALITQLLNHEKPQHARLSAALAGRQFDPLQGAVETTAPPDPVARFPETGGGYQTPPPFRKSAKQVSQEHGELVSRVLAIDAPQDPYAPFGTF